MVHDCSKLSVMNAHIFSTNDKKLYINGIIEKMGGGGTPFHPLDGMWKGGLKPIHQWRGIAIGWIRGVSVELGFELEDLLGHLL